MHVYMEVFSYFDLHEIYLSIFSIGLALAAGSALLSNVLFADSIRDNTISKDEYRLLRQSRTVVWFGILLYALAGIGLFTLSAEAMLGLGIFYASMVIVALMLGNALIFHYYYLPKIKGRIGKTLCDTDTKSTSSYLIACLILSESISVVSWLFLILHHALYRLPVSFAAVMTLFLIALLAVGCLFYLNARPVCTKDNFRLLMRMGGVIGFLLFVFLALAVSDIRFFIGIEDSERISKHATDEGGVPEHTHTGEGENTTFTRAEVARHSNIEDCWVIIEERVYDATPAAELYPEVYSCGEDITENYRQIKADGVSERVKSYEIGLLGFTSEEIASHSTDEDCWLVIDGLVFDATAEAVLHPAMFNCGKDVSMNYHRNHGEGISDRMMRSHIGSVDDGVTFTPSGNPEHARGDFAPYRELYVEEGNWDNLELMVVVEKDPEKLLFIDGSTHRPLGRIHDIGFQPHTSVYSPDGKYMFIIARDGWLTKIDLDTLDPVHSVRVGESSRGTALTDDGRYLVIGNYIPGNAVVVDPITMEILKEIPTVGTLNGKEVESRVGAVIESGSQVIIALKDLNSVWIIDTIDSSFPVIAKHEGIGENETPLHDAFLSADGRYYVVASMGSHTVWVMDTETWEPVGEVPTGETPHTGPGATWGNKVYIPALGEGLITAIDMNTWEPVAKIKTGGPGLFIRSYPEDPDYPYVWTETAFGDKHDEIYVIDARTDEIVKTLVPVEGESSWHPEFTRNGQFVYVVSQGGNKVVVYDAYNFDEVTRLEAVTPSAVSNIGIRINEKGL